MSLLKFLRLTSLEKLTVLEAVYFLARARLKIKRESFGEISSHLTDRRQTKPANNSDDILLIKHAIGRVRERLPWENKCLPRALAAAWMLKRRGISFVLFFGVSRTENSNLKAHAWVIANDIFVTGRKGHRQYNVVSKTEA